MAFLLALIGTRASISLAWRWGIVDKPGDLKLQNLPVPRFGGMGIAVGVLVPLLLLGDVDTYLSSFLPLSIILATGALDDARSLPPKVKLGGLIMAALAFAGIAVAVEGWEWRFAVLGVVLILILTNAMNLIDGMDGLAASQGAVIGASLAGWSYATAGEIPIASVVLVGGLIAFLFFNFPPARTFMGDAGSLFIGGFLAIEGARLFLTAGDTGTAPAPVLFLIFLIPLMDMFLSIARRLFRGQPWYQGDRDHLYDRLRRWLRSDLRVLGVMIVLSLVTGIAGVWSSILPAFWGYLMAALAAGSVFCLWVRLKLFSLYSSS